jgi:L-cysteine S-thiosulfotransferase
MCRQVLRSQVSFRLLRQRLRAGAALVGALLAGTAWGQGSAEQGFRLMNTMSGGNCLACHSLPNQKGSASTFAPSLNQVGKRYTTDELRQWVTDARQIKPDTLMPPFGTTAGTHRAIVSQSILSAEDIDHIVAALQTLR